MTKSTNHKTTKTAPPTTTQIEDLQTEAAAAGDLEMVKICDNALDGDDDAMATCWQVVMDGQG